MDAKKAFYTKFVNEETFSSKVPLSNRRKYFSFLFLIPSITGAIALTSTLFGLNLKYVGPLIMLLINVLLLTFTVCMFIWLLNNERKYKVFNKKQYLILFNIPYYALMIGSCIFAIFFTNYEEGTNGFGAEFNPFFFLCIYLPLFIGYTFFLYYVYFKPLALYSYGKKSKDINTQD